MKKPQGQYFDYIDIDSIDNKNHRITSPKHLLVKNAPSRASREVCNGSVLFSLVRPYLENIAYISAEYQNCIASTGFYVCNSNGAFTPEFMFVLMTSQYVIMGLNEYMKGDNSPSIKKEHIENWLYPVPPLKEQYRILSSLNEAISLYETINTNKTDLAELVKTAKSRILDLAIRGKLVPQDPNDEPASVLLERIQAEKEELIKQGKIKRNKKDSVIFKGDDNSYYEKMDDKITCIDDEIPFAVPDNWCWERLGNLLSIERGASPRPIKSFLTNSNDGVIILMQDCTFSEIKDCSNNGGIAIREFAPSVVPKRGIFA